MSRIIGIDLGTTNSLVATVDSGIPLVIADAQGRRLTPSVVHFPPPPAPPVVGQPARHLQALHPAQTVHSIKRFMGRRGNELAQEEMLVTYPVRGVGTSPVTIEIHGRSYTPEEISAQILGKLRKDAEAALGETVDRAVITVPAYFNDAQRAATKRAGELAGFTVERIVNEPTAAALAYGLDRLHEKSRIAVFDLGGGTFDLSILELHEGLFQVLATNGNTRLGGDDLDRRIVDRLLELIRADGGPDVASDPGVIARLREAAEQAKVLLSTDSQTEIALPFLAPGYSFRHLLTRSELEDLTRDIITRTRTHCLRALSDARLETADLDQVILVGGQTRMPLVRRFVAELFGCAEFDEPRGDIRLGTSPHRPARPLLNTSQIPEETVALGAAIQAAILSGDLRKVLLLDVTPLSLGLETFGGLMNVIIPRNSTIPVKAGEVFTTAVDQQRSMLIHVLQGERDRARDNWSLGRFTIDFTPAPRGATRVGVQFEIDANGILQVLARDIQTGRQTVVEMKSAVDVDDDAVQRMVQESVDHAFDDLAARRWIEARLRADEALSATRTGLASLSSELPPELLAAIQQAVQETEAALATGNSDSGTGDLSRLRNCVAQLDEATRPLADLMMERAFSALLEQRGLIGPPPAPELPHSLPPEAAPTTPTQDTQGMRRAGN